MDAPNYRIVPYSPELDAEIARLQTNLWSGDAALNAAYLRWKYAENPFATDPFLMQVALLDGRAVAMRGMFGSLWEVGDSATRHLLPHADDFVIDPRHRNRGVAHRIMAALVADAERRESPFAIALSVSPVTLVGSLAAGWRSVGSYRTLWSGRLANPSLQRLTHWLRRVPWLADLHRRPARRHFRSVDREVGAAAGGVSVGREPRPRAMAELVARLPWDGRLRHVRDAAYFAWRFRSPLSEYRFFYAGDDELRGYLVLQRFVSDRFDRGWVSIADWEAEDDATRAALLDVALRHGRFGSIRIWTAGASESTGALLRERGFRAREAGGIAERNDGPLVRRLGASSAADRWTLGGRDVLDIDSWDLRMIQSMAT